MHEFSRTERLIGAGNQQMLAKSTIVVFGVGGVGSHCIEALARCGIGRLILIDNDRVSLTNLNRQSIAYHSTIGQYKTHVMKARIADINPAAQVETFETFVLPDNLAELLDGIGSISYMIDAIDTVTAKLAIVQYCTDHRLPLISSMGTGNKLHAELFEIADISNTSVCPLCRVMRKELKNRGICRLKVLYSKEQPLSPECDSEETTSKRSLPGSISFVPPVAGLLIAGEAVRDLLQTGKTSAPDTSAEVSPSVSGSDTGKKEQQLSLTPPLLKPQSLFAADYPLPARLQPFAANPR